MREVLRMVEAVAGQPLTIREEPRRAGDPAYLVARADRIRTELGWQPRYDDLQAIVSSSLAWERKAARESLELRVSGAGRCWNRNRFQS